uniref:Unannotated protein n=1 Tax=freshwater metagenome TaxID=449393 RepID=A0A6J7PR92_9ZZZZ
MQRCPWAQAPHTPQRLDRDWRTCGHHEPNCAERRQGSGCRADHVRERCGRGEHHRGPDTGTCLVERTRGERGGRGDVHVGEAGHHAEGGPKHSEGGECCNKAVCRRDAVHPPERVTLRAQLTVGVTHTLGRAGGARGEHHGGGISGLRLGKGEACDICRCPVCTQRAQRQHLRARRPAKHTSRSDRLGGPDHVAHSGRAHRSTEAVQAQPAVGDHSHGADSPARVHCRQEVDSGWNEHGNPISRTHTARAHGGGEPRNTAGEGGPRDTLVRRRIAHGRRVQRRVRHDLGPQGSVRRRRVGPLCGSPGLLDTDTDIGRLPRSDRCLNIRGDRHLQHCEVPGATETVQSHIAETPEEVLGEVIVEHRVTRTPHQTDRDVEAAETGCDRGERCCRRMPIVEGHVAHEFRHRLP